MTRVLVLIPTFNESENIESSVQSVRESLPDADILIIDDSSPDGTGVIAERMAMRDRRVAVLHRRHKAGLGAAYLAGFEIGLDKGYDVLVEFDADGSHPASVLPRLVTEVSDPRVGLTIGSRWVEGGAVTNWPWRRVALSKAGNTYARILLGLRVRDSTAGFRAYRAECLRKIELIQVRTKGYGFQVDMTRRTRAAGFDIHEIPITFRERVHGESKMTGSIVLEAMFMVTVWGLRRPYDYVQRAFSRR